MTDRVQELEEDIRQLKKLLLDSERTNVQNYLAQQVSKLKTELDTLNATKVSEVPKKKEVYHVPSEVKEIDKSSFLPMNKYGWDQEGKKVKYLSDNLGSSLVSKESEIKSPKNKQNQSSALGQYK